MRAAIAVGVVLCVVVVLAMLSSTSRSTPSARSSRYVGKRLVRGASQAMATTRQDKHHLLGLVHAVEARTMAADAMTVAPEGHLRELTGVDVAMLQATAQTHVDQHLAALARHLPKAQQISPELAGPAGWA